MDGPRVGGGAGGGRLCSAQCLGPVAADAAGHAERQLVAVGVVGQSIEFERTTVAVGRPAGLIGRPAGRLRGAAIHLERTAWIRRRCAGFAGAERIGRIDPRTSGRARAAALADAGVGGRRPSQSSRSGRSGRPSGSGGPGGPGRSVRSGAEYGCTIIVRRPAGLNVRPVTGPGARAVQRLEGWFDGACGRQLRRRLRARHGRRPPGPDRPPVRRNLRGVRRTDAQGTGSRFAGARRPRQR